MINWKKIAIGKAIRFNPPESITKGSLVKKIPMGYLTEFQRKINGFELSEYNSGPKFRNKDTLVAKITPCLENGKTAYVDVLKDNEVAFGSSEFIVLRKTDLTDSKFIYYLAISPTFRNRAISCMEGTSGRKRVNDKTLKNFELPIPSIEYQKKIAKVLSDLDAKIEVNNKINQELEAMAKTLYDYWFVQFDFPDANGKPYKSSGGRMVYNKELNREIPEGWEFDIVENLLAKDNKTKKIPSSEYLDKGKIPIIDQSMKFICGYTNVEESIIDTIEPRIIFGDHTRIVKLINFDFARGADGTQVLLSNNPRMPQHLFYHALLKIDLSNYGYARHFKFLKDTKIVIPHLEVANKFEKFIEGFFKKIRHNIFENHELTELRDWLLPMLMNGQVTVGEAEKELGMVAENGEAYNISHK
ncbi:type I restriction endonuclease subunit S [Aquaticitalea lipolytica]|uniref:Type I restriction endonuclease subunit S n=1 Tax=Aquaticitalea lipolytica TaxID=1247562 RepID=A0A8J2TN92_9FLAO|nr:restriction endonuclease subunit S [Aquaticitalea lipolytica]GFZ76018.1 type I restriction endonuclease subunit S [Aquaticitalea lipolytica]